MVGRPSDGAPSPIAQLFLSISLGNLKLTDFGLATVFLYKGKRRLIKTPCGTPPYVGGLVGAFRRPLADEVSQNRLTRST